MIAWWRCVWKLGPQIPSKVVSARSEPRFKKNSDCRNNSWISNLDSITRVQEPRLEDRPPVAPQSGVPTQAASVPSTLGPFLCLRNHDGKGVQRVNEGRPALGGAGMKEAANGRRDPERAIRTSDSGSVRMWRGMMSDDRYPSNL